MVYKARVQAGIDKASECWWKTKTEMCKHHIRGKCDRGAQCTFAHSSDELRGEVARDHGASSSVTGATSSSVTGASSGVRGLIRPRTATSPTPPENEEQRKQMRTVNEVEVVDAPPEGPSMAALPVGSPAPPEGTGESTGDEDVDDLLVGGFRWREGDIISNSTCVAVLPHKGPLVWLSSEREMENHDLHGAPWMTNAGVIVRCDHGEPVWTLDGMYQVSAHILDECPSPGTQIPNMDAMMPMMYNTCMMVQCVRKPMY
jgi:hypothetical protein